MNLSHLYYFKSLVEEGSFSSAAEKLYVAPSTLSLAISSLEKELGSPLLRKKRSGIVLTKEGDEFYHAVVTATNSLDDAIDFIRNRSVTENAVITIGAVYSVQSESWSNLLRAYRKETGHRVRLKVVQGTTESLLAGLREGELDLIFAGLLPEHDHNITSIPCFTQRVALVVSKENPLSKRASISLDELVGKRVISYRLHEGPFVSELGNLLAINPKVTISDSYGDEISLCAMAVADPDTVAIACHSWLVDSFTGLKALEIEEAPEDFHQFFLSYRKHGRQRLCVEQFLSLAKRIDYGNESPELLGLDDED